MVTWAQKSKWHMESEPYGWFISKWMTDSKASYLLVHGSDTKGWFNSADEAKQAAREHMQSDKRAA